MTIMPFLPLSAEEVERVDHSGQGGPQKETKGRGRKRKSCGDAEPSLARKRTLRRATGAVVKVRPLPICDRSCCVAVRQHVAKI